MLLLARVHVLFSGGLSDRANAYEKRQFVLRQQDLRLQTSSCRADGSTVASHAGRIWQQAQLVALFGSTPEDACLQRVVYAIHEVLSTQAATGRTRQRGVKAAKLDPYLNPCACQMLGCDSCFETLLRRPSKPLLWSAFSGPDCFCGFSVPIRVMLEDLFRF